jgi:hypothetical protein
MQHRRFENTSVALYNHSSVIWERLCSGKGSNVLEDQSPQLHAEDT